MNGYSESAIFETNSVKKKLQNIYIFLFIIIISTLLYTPRFQNDTYWLINTGNYIVHNGFPHTEPFTFHKGLDFIAQQWLSTIIFYASYNIGGETGIHVLTICLCALIIFLVYRLALQITCYKVLIASYITAFIGVLLCVHMVPRPQVFSLLIIVIEISVLEFYVRNYGKQRAIIALLPLLSLLLVNLHSALWPFFFILYIPYLIDSFKFKISRVEGQGYRKIPLFTGFLFSITAGFVNPYGYRAVTYLFKSYGNSLYIIDEMHSPDFKSLLGIVIFILIITIALIYINVTGTTRLRYVLITIGTLFMGLSSLRSMVFFYVFGLLFLAYYLKDIELKNTMPAKRRLRLIILAVLALLIFRVTRIQDTDKFDGKYKPEHAVQFIKNNIDLTKMRLYNHFNTGGFIEFSGIKTFIDSRGEIFLKKLNGKEDIWEEFINSQNGKIYYSDFIKEYSFTHFLVYRGRILDNCLKNDPVFRMLYEDDHYVVYEKVI